MMNLRNHARTLAMASMLALAVVSIPAAQVHAQPNGNHPQPNLCARFDPESNHWDFAVPGEIRAGADGHKYICGEDGQWHQVADLGIGTSGPLRPTAPTTISSTLGS
jgi:hypothetical protein